MAEFPVQSAVNRSIVTADVAGVIPLMSSTPYSFTFWTNYDLIIVRPPALCKSLRLSLLTHRVLHIPDTRDQPRRTDQSGGLRRSPNDQFGY